MNENIDVSVVVITLNEADNLERCLRSVGFAREIVVVDSFSEDLTVDIAHRFTDHVYQHTFAGHIEQKNYALALATHDWVLSLDADEVLTPELEAAIGGMTLTLLEGREGFLIRRKNLFLGKWMNHTGWGPGPRVRLFKKSSAHWGGENPHDQVILADPFKVGELNGELLHYTSPSLTKHLEKT